jgi:hypothetical protein
MRYTKPQILRTGKATLAIQSNKAESGFDSIGEMTVPSYAADE